MSRIFKKALEEATRLAYESGHDRSPGDFDKMSPAQQEQCIAQFEKGLRHYLDAPKKGT